MTTDCPFCDHDHAHPANARANLTREGWRDRAAQDFYDLHPDYTCDQDDYAALDAYLDTRADSSTLTLRAALDAHHRGLALAGDGADKCAICATLVRHPE